MEHVLEHNQENTKIFGFWIYLMTDLIIFAVLFAAFIVHRTSTFGGPTGKELFEMPSVLAETVILLTSSFTCALAMGSVHKGKRNWAMFWFLMTFALGVSFLVLELKEFAHFVSIGASWKRSAFLSSFFTLVGTHGLHITVGLLWMAVMMLRLYIRPLVDSSISRMHRMALFWHFLDFVWIFIFTVVYGWTHLS